MKRVLIISTCLCLSLMSCGRKAAVSETKSLGEDSSLGGNVLSLGFLQRNQANYVDHEVTVATYLFTHEDGPWIGDGLKKPLDNTMLLKVSEQSRLIPKDSTKFRWWYEYQEGYPVILTGVFRVGRWQIGHERFIENHPYIEISIAKEVGSDDPVWKAHTDEDEQTAN